MDGSDGHTDLRMSMPDNVGAFYRSSTKPDGTALCLGDQLKLLLTLQQLVLIQCPAAGKPEVFDVCCLCPTHKKSEYTARTVLLCAVYKAVPEQVKS